MNSPVLLSLIVSVVLASWGPAASAAAANRGATPPVITSTRVNAEGNRMIISGSNFGRTRPIVTLGDRVVKVRRHSAREVVVEIPEGAPMGTYRLTVTNGQFNVTSEPFSAALFADAEARGRIH